MSRDRTPPRLAHSVNKEPTPEAAFITAALWSAGLALLASDAQITLEGERLCLRDVYCALFVVFAACLPETLGRLEAEVIVLTDNCMIIGYLI